MKALSIARACVMGAILASMPAVETHVVAFNHEEVVDLTEHCGDPVDLLFGVQLGPAHGVVDVLDRRRIGILVARPEIERDRHDAVRRHEFMA